MKKLWIAIAALVWILALATWRDRCDQAWFRWGIDVSACPDGELRQTAELSVSARRGVPGQLQLRALAHYTERDSDRDRSAAVPQISDIALSLSGAKLAARPIEVARWDQLGGSSIAAITLPDIPDGDYQLRASFRTALGAGEVTAPLAVYAPARIHVLTDRPLYEPGNTVRFRAVALRARDLVPLDHRPGTWVVKDPQNEVLLEEAAPAGEWGVVAGSFPLDRAARTGTWHVIWRSGDATDEVAFTVEPFTLPRFRVDATSDRPFYRPGDRPLVKGAVLYSSGAPVGGAAVDVTWQIEGDWPPPAEWIERVLPRTARTAPSGRFDLALPEIPSDLQGRATLIARISAVDPAGDRAIGEVRVLLSEDGLQASAVTELGDGLVESFNNRLYLRATTPDGRVLANAQLTVTRAWIPGDKGFSARSDEDGVASLQIDPGAPVNIVIPARPFRPAPRRALVARSDAHDLIGGRGASLADQVELERWLPALAPCARWVEGHDAAVKLALRVDAAGAVLAAAAPPTSLGRCAAGVARGRRLAAGGDRLYGVDLQFSDPGLPVLTESLSSVLDPPAGLDQQVAELARSTRDCLPTAASAEGQLGSLLTWRVQAGGKAVEVGWIADPAGGVGAAGGGGAAALACVQARFSGARLALAEPAATDALGVVRFSISQPAGSGAQARPQPTTMLGYELAVRADLPGAPATRLRMAPGTVPPLRMRVSPVLPAPGEAVTAQLIRGPQYAGELPRKIALDCLASHGEAELDKDHRAQLAIDKSVEGWCTVSGGGSRALIYVRPRAELIVSVTPVRDRYAPGDRAELAIQTTLGGTGGPAAVGLFGVDASLGQIAPLLGADAMGRIRPQVETTSPAFGALDGQALTLGRIRGANAAAATVLRVASIPTPPELDATVNGRGATRFDPIEELTDRFYIVLAELHAQTQRWETTAPAAEKMAPATMAGLWRAALAACAARGQRIDDAYGRALSLSRLPEDLLSLTDPRAVVTAATRLPEDVENWPAWVARENPQ